MLRDEHTWTRHHTSCLALAAADVAAHADGTWIGPVGLANGAP